MKWNKRGLLYRVDQLSDWQYSHAYLPTPIVQDDTIRLYVAFWDKTKVGRIGYIDLDKDKPNKIVGISKKPVLDLGFPGSFADNGVSPSFVWCKNRIKNMLYIGWQLGTTVPYHLFTGLARSVTGGETFETTAPVPLLDRSRRYPIARSAAVMPLGRSPLASKANPQLYYLGGTNWVWFEKYKRYWFDSNIIIWYDTEKEEVLKLPRNEEFMAYGRPWVIWSKNICHLWFIYRHFDNPTKYFQGHATSTDGVHFDTDYGIVIPPGKSGDFDDKDQSHMTVAKVNGRWIGWYMGNSFGKEGLGWMEAESLDE